MQNVATETGPERKARVARHRRWGGERIEYALIAGLIIVAAVAIVGGMMERRAKKAEKVTPPAVFVPAK